MNFRNILLAEDDPQDVELALTALQELTGIFWTEINEPPPLAGSEEAPQSGEVNSPENMETAIENPTPHPAPGG